MENKLDWLALLINKESNIISSRNWLEAKFSTLITLAFTAATVLFNLFSKNYFGEQGFLFNKFCSLLVFWLIVQWVISFFDIYKLNFIKSHFRWMRRSNIIATEKILNFFNFSIFSFLHVYIYWYFFKLGFHYNILLVFPCVYSVLALSMLIDLRNPSKLDESEVPKVSDNEGKRILIHLKIFLFALGFLSCFSLFLAYRYFYLSNSADTLLNIKITAISLIMLFLIHQASKAYVAKEDVPDLNELQFNVMSDEFSNEKEFIDEYEKTLLGKSIFKYAIQLLKRNKEECIHTNRSISKVAAGFEKIKIIKDIEGEEYRLEYLLLEGGLEAAKTYLAIERWDLKRISKAILDNYKLSNSERNKISDFINKEILNDFQQYGPQIEDFEKEFKKLPKSKKIDEWLSKIEEAKGKHS